VFACIFIVLTSLIYIIVPHLLNASKLHFNGRIFDQILEGTLSTYLPLAVFYSSMMAENNANIDERTYILSRPVSRNEYLLGKLLSSLTMIIVLYAVIIPIIFIGRSTSPVAHYSGPDGQPDVGNLSTIQTFYFTLAVFFCMLVGSVVGTCYKYYFKEKLTSVMMLVLSIALYIIVGNVVGQTDPSKLFDFETLLIPLGVLFPVSIGGTIFGFVLTNKANVKV
jgi:hypothetical protein